MNRKEKMLEIIRADYSLDKDGLSDFNCALIKEKNGSYYITLRMREIERLVDIAAPGEYENMSILIYNKYRQNGMGGITNSLVLEKHQLLMSYITQAKISDEPVLYVTEADLKRLAIVVSNEIYFTKKLVVLPEIVSKFI